MKADHFHIRNTYAFIRMVERAQIIFSVLPIACDAHAHLLFSSVTQSSRMRRRRRASRRKWRQRRASERASGLQKSVVTRSRAAGRKAGAGRGRSRPKLSEGRHSRRTRTLRSCSARACKFQTSGFRSEESEEERRLTSLAVSSSPPPPVSFAQADLSIVVLDFRPLICMCPKVVR